MKWIKSVFALLLMLLLLIGLNYVYNQLDSSSETTSDLVEEVIFPHDKVVEVNIEIDEDTYIEMNANATEEEYVVANITYNGYTLNNIGIRPKGNSSLRDVYQSDSDRYSFKIDFNYYVDDQSFYGIKKLNLNNLFSDPSMMAEYLGYEMLDELGAVSPRTTYVKLSINDEYFGLYLAVEHVTDEFLYENFGNSTGELYKPEQGVGSDLAYISDEGMDYTGLIAENKDSYDNEEIANLIKTIEEDRDLDTILDMDSFLKYLAVSTMTVHLDSYQGGMFHNYYLYNNDGVFEWIAWDLNMIFNGFPGSGLTDEEAIQFLIDEPVNGFMENYPLVQTVLAKENYVAQYHEYLAILSEGYLKEETLSNKVLSVYEMIHTYVKNDPTSFYSYEEFENGLYGEDLTEVGLLDFAKKRVENVVLQLSGEMESTNFGEGNVGSALGSGMEGQTLPEVDGGQMLPDGEFGENLPEGDNGQMLPDGEFGENPPEEDEGQILPDGELGENPLDMEMEEMPPMNEENQNIGDSNELSNEIEGQETEGILLIFLVCLLTIMGVYLKKKH
jgi:hypothetical protein